jgi:RloB-like protein
MAAKRQQPVRVERQLKRRGPQFAQRRKFTIVCEAQTEVTYFKDIVRQGSIRPDVHLVPKRAKHSDPRAFAKSVDRSSDEEGDETWFVFDIEVAPTRPGIEQFITAAESDGFGAAWSNPCFEVWLIYHFEPRSSPFTTSRDAEVALRAFLPQFRKGLSPGPLLHARLNDALRHSDIVDESHKRADRTPQMANPASRMAALMRRLVSESEGS